MKIERMSVFECLCMGRIFVLPEMAKNEILDFSGPTCVSKSFHPYFDVNVVLEKFQ